VFEALRAKDIMVNLHYIPVHIQPYYQQMGFKRGDFPQSEQYYREAISIPMHVTLSDGDLRFVTYSLREAMCL
jgi:dTDP-4-amino-4,6-dideoxygalactose transaminase